MVGVPLRDRTDQGGPDSNEAGPVPPTSKLWRTGEAGQTSSELPFGELHPSSSAKGDLSVG